MSIEKLLPLLRVLAWIVSIGLLIKVGSIAISYFVSISNPAASSDLYRGMDLSDFRDVSFIHYSFLVGYRVALILCQSYVAYLMTIFFRDIDIDAPFSEGIVPILDRISCYVLSIGIIAVVHNVHLELIDRLYDMTAEHISSAAIILAAVLYILAHIYKRGVEIQSDNQLTI